MDQSRSRELLLDFLQKQEEAALPPPSLREVCRVVGFRSTNASLKLVKRLQASGEVIYEPRRARSLRLAQRSEFGVVMLGSIAAGFPDEPDSVKGERLQIEPIAFGIEDPADAFALRVRGDSMTGIHFFDGDVVLLDRSAKPKNNDVVAALIDQECTLKTLILENGKAWLKAENPAYPDLVPAHDLQIQGVAKAVIRILAA